MIIDRLSRTVVILSLLAAVAAGLAPYASRPAVAAALVATIAAAAIAARLRFAHAAIAVLLVSCISYGLVRWPGGAALATTPFWLAAFVGLVVGGAPWSTWRAPHPWRLPIAWWALGVALSWPVIVVRDTGFGIDDPAVAGAVLGAAVVQMACALWLDTLLGSSDLLGFDRARQADEGERRHEHASVGYDLLSALAASALITALGAVYQRGVDLAWLSGDSWVRLGRATGLMGDANPMGVVTALFAPLVLAGALRLGPRIPWLERWPAVAARTLAAVVAVLLWYAAWSSGARSTLILFAGGAMGLAVAWALSRGIGLRRVAIGASAAAAVAVLILWVALPRLPASSPVVRLVDALPTASPGAMVYELLWRRDGYGLAAAEAIGDHPLNGVGIGRFSPLAPAYYARVEGRAIPPDNAQSLWRHTLAERGVLGLAPVAWLTLLTIASLWRARSDPRRAVLSAMLVAFGVVLMFGYPVQDAAVAMTLATFVALPGRQDDGRAHAPHWGTWAVVLAASVLGATLDGLR